MVELDLSAIIQGAACVFITGGVGWVIKLLMDIRKDLHKVVTDVAVTKRDVKANQEQIQELKDKVA